MKAWLRRRVQRVLEHRFARAYGWDLDYLHGLRKPGAIGDDYRLRLPVGSLFRPVASTSVHTLRIRHVGLFGNRVTQLKQAAYVGELLRSERLVFDSPNELFLDGRVGDFSVFSDGSRSDEGRKSHLRGGFYFRHALGLNLAPLDHRRLIETYVRPLLAPELFVPAPHVRPGDVGLHFRSGDIMTGSLVHPAYGQPPAAFYLKAFEACGGERAWLVSEDDRNPAQEEVAQALRDRGVEVLGQSSTLQDDIRVLLSVDHMIASSGTFCPALAEISETLKTYHSFGEFPHHPLRVLAAADVEVIKYWDVSGAFSAAVMANNWRAGPEQLELIRSHPMEDLDSARVS